jgi:hypothetical protein
MRMKTVQIQCGSCRRVMAVQIEHLGSQVHCPHCQAIVQAPPAPARAADGRGDNDDTASIFAGPEVSDDILLGGPNDAGARTPLQKMRSPIQAAAPAEPMGTFLPPGRPGAADAELDRISEGTTEAIVPPPGAAGSSAASESPADDGDLAALAPRRVAKSTALAPILLVFLIPYAILATLVIAYLLVLLNQSRLGDPLERLPDPKPRDGGARFQERVQHDFPLPDKLKTRLQQPVRIGALQVTPVKVQLTASELVLHLRMKNVSADQVFNPISQEFMKYTGDSPPYTYLDLGQKKIYGGFPEWLRGPEGKEERFGGDIAPGQEELIRIVTSPKFKDDVKRIANSQATLLWRVQVRRGFVETRAGNQVSATAVVGVEFSAQDIIKES